MERLLGVAASVALPTSMFAAPAAAAAPEVLTMDQVAAALPAAELQKWNALPEAAKQQTLRILADPSFAVPGGEVEVEARWPQVDIGSTTSVTTTKTNPLAATSNAPATGGVTTQAVGSCVSRYTQWWKMLGITYAEVTTSVGYGYNGSTVTSVNRCYGTWKNYVPLRSIGQYSWYTALSGGTVTCKTEWSLSRPLQPTEWGIQGTKVNRNGTILQRWSI